MLLFAPLFNIPILREILSMPTWTPAQITNTILIFIWISYVWNSYLDIRQFKVTSRTTSVPAELVGVIDEPTFAKSRLYYLDLTKHRFVSDLHEILLKTAVLMFGYIPYLWALSGKIANPFGYGNEHEITQSVIFTLLDFVIRRLLNFPFTLYRTFVTEERHGFNKETPGIFFKDTLKTCILHLAVAPPLISLLIYIVKIGGNYSFIFIWLFRVILKWVFMTVYADYIAPLFNKYTPLPEGELWTRIESLANSMDFPLTKIFVVDGSKRSSHSNAYLSGFWNNKRIVLSDNLLEDNSLLIKGSEKKYEEEEEEKEEESEGHKQTGCNNDEVVALLAHELGHWKLNHALKNIVIDQVDFFIRIAVFALLYRSTVLYSAFGFFSEKPIIIIAYLIVCDYVLSPYKEMISFIMAVKSRRYEFQADAFAKELHKAADLSSALIKGYRDNFIFPVHDWLKSAVSDTHPPLLQRIRALGKID